MEVEIAALVTWVAAAIVGLYQLTTSLANGGLRGQATKVTRFPATLTLSHLLLGSGGLVIWVFYLITTRVMYAWAAFALLAVVALLGFMMLTRWLVGRGGRHARCAEPEVPIAAVFVHGGVAITTFVLVLFTALVVGNS
ncbi:MAG TPA: hypothetical protein VFU43_06000 [Streptosporangiaceae bacterium]|nr:hypothetical protein [Streptosporangiaceae bacterium]